MKTLILSLLLAVTGLQVYGGEAAAGPAAAGKQRARTSTDIEIFADGPVVYTRSNSTVIYTNNVRSSDSRNWLSCDVLTMELSESVSASALLDPSASAAPKTTNNPVKWILAEGNVVLSNRQGRALCGKAVYDFATELVTLSGSARIVPVPRILSAITNRLGALAMRWDSVEMILRQNDTEATWRFTGLQRLNKSGAAVGEKLEGTVRAVQIADQWQIKGEGELASVQLTLPGRPFLESASGWSTSSRIIYNLKTEDIRWDPPFEFKGTAAGELLSLPGASSSR